MTNDGNIKNFSAADIEKYWKGQLSPGQMNALEKAAMDDPFLADALEGYQNTPTPVSDISSLQKKLNERTSRQAKVVGMPQKRFPFMRAAAVVIILGGIGILAQQLFFKQEKEIARVEESITKDNAAETVTNSNTQPSENKTEDTKKVITQPATSDLANPPAAKANEKDKAAVINPDITATQKNEEKITSVTSSENNIPPPTAGSAAAAKTVNDDKSVLAKQKDTLTEDVASFKETENANQKRMVSQQKSKAPEGILTANNTFNYRVIDAQNNPVPFANVSNTRDGVGTYTDIRGNFNLISSDSVLDVQIRSLGYDPLTYKLSPSKTPNSIVLQEDEEVRAAILANSRKVVSTRAREETAELEEPEVGWGNYNTYIANNISIPENLRSKKSGTEVELSFDVDKTGKPVNIKITKSSQCSKCDEEAIRLLKEGPKWTRKGKRSKTKVSISIDK